LPPVQRWTCELAEDLTHDVFVKLLEHLPRLAEGDDLGGWLYRVTANLAISRLRREQSLLGRLHRLWSDEPTPSAESLFEQQEAAADALAMLHDLPARERMVVCMKLLDGQSQREIAATLSLSEGYVSKLLARGYERIRAGGWEVGDDQA
jgi:RNA polymerase sigma factor (sigma-70 family)